jgi:hypothetical protein
MSEQTNPEFDRKALRAKTEKESKLSDLKQHATKMLQAFAKFNDFSSNRAIWELVQNACDLTTNGELVTDYRNSQFSFSHNGKQFTTNALISLIKQVSGDKDGESEIPPVGKYGTGFLTTHSLGRKFYINSFLEASDNISIKIENFLIDRSAKDWPELAEKIQCQLDKAFGLIDSGHAVENPELVTTFTYIPVTEQEQIYVNNSFSDLNEYVPIVLTVNDRIKSFKIINKNGEITEFVRKAKEPEGNPTGFRIFKTTILKDGDDLIIYSIKNVDGDIEIILPVLKDFSLRQIPDRVARLFLYYPLIGSEKFGINFIINSTAFMPTEPRDGIHLKSNNDQVHDDEKTNRKLIIDASDLLFKFLKSDLLRVTNPLLYANINFKRDSDDNLLNEYFKGLQASWINEFKELNIVETYKGFKKVPEVAFIDPELLIDPENFDSIYYLAQMLNEDIPSKSVITKWSEFVKIWDCDGLKFITNEDLAKYIAERKLADFDYDKLKIYYDYLVKAKPDLFSSNKLIPNIDGVFQSFGVLRHAKNIDDKLIEIGRKLIPANIDQLIDERFSYDFKFEDFTRKDFAGGVNSRIGEIVADDQICINEFMNKEEMVQWPTEQSAYLDYEFFRSLLDFCKLNTKIESDSRPSKLMGHISTYYGLEPQLIQLSSLDSNDELELRPAQKRLVKVFFNTLLLQKDTWVKDHLRFLHDVLDCNEDRYKDVYSTSRIYPNQVFYLCMISELKKDVDLNEEIIKLYNDVLSTDIRKSVANKYFDDLLTEKNELVNNKSLAMSIEEVFFSTDIHDINRHPFKDTILSIIKRLDDPFFSGLFTRLDDKKASLILQVVINERTKDDIFSIVTLKESQINKLGQLIKRGNLDEIIKQAEENIILAQEKQSDFNHKYAIGTYIEDKIRERIGAELASKISIEKGDGVDVDNVQNGQDIIIWYGNEPIYFIEVKSRWDPQNSVTMSKPQMTKASKNELCYSLVSVDITKYSGTNDKYQLEIEEIVPLFKAVNNIGKDVKPLIFYNLAAETDPSSPVTLSDYRGIVNQETIKAGSDFEAFVSHLVSHIERRINELQLK